MSTFALPWMRGPHDDALLYDEYPEVAVLRPATGQHRPETLGRDGGQVYEIFAQELPDGGFVLSLSDVTAERAAMRAPRTGSCCHCEVSGVSATTGAVVADEAGNGAAGGMTASGKGGIWLT